MFIRIVIVSLSFFGSHHPVDREMQTFRSAAPKSNRIDRAFVKGHTNWDSLMEACTCIVIRYFTGLFVIVDVNMGIPG